jgi:hypothetical protein
MIAFTHGVQMPSSAVALITNDLAVKCGSRIVGTVSDISTGLGHNGIKRLPRKRYRYEGENLHAILQDNVSH